MSNPATRPVSYSDLLNLPDNVVEIITGELITYPRPAPVHAAAAFASGSKYSAALTKTRRMWAWRYVNSR